MNKGKPDCKEAKLTETDPSEQGGPVRKEPLPLEFPGVHYMDDAEVEPDA